MRMSIPIMRATLDCERFSGLRKLVLVSLASFADADGSSVFPSIATIARQTGLSRRPVQQHIRALEADGVLVKVAPSRRHRPTEYRIALGGFRGVASNTPRRV